MSSSKPSRIPISSPDITPLERKYVDAALKSGWAAPLGPDLDAFEVEMAQYTGRRHAVGLSSGTAALHLGLLALGVKPGDVVVTATMTFVASANAITYANAEPFFVDSEADSGNMDPHLLDEALTELRRAGKNVGAVLPVDLLGRVADYPAIEAVVQKHEAAFERKIPILADAAEAVGARRDGVPAGAFGDAAVFSFNGNKVMTTSGGGMLLTDSRELANHVRYLSTQARQPVVHYEHTDIGYNYRLSNILAALGRAQIRRLDEMIGRRQQNRATYRNLFAQAPGVMLFQENGHKQDNHWLTAILVNEDTAGWAPADLAEALAADNIESRPLWKPMHLQPAFQGADAIVNETAERLFRTGLTLPSGSALTSEQVDRVSAVITNFLEERA